MKLGQYRCYNRPGWGLYVSWAFFSDEVEQAFIDQTRKLQPEDWKSGPNCWAIDVATIGKGSSVLGQVFRNLRKELAPVHTFKYRRWYPNRPRRYVTMEFADAVPA
jgi:hemolysin-activating ACP:hemolysin acyltransferase